MGFFSKLFGKKKQPQQIKETPKESIEEAVSEKQAAPTVLDDTQETDIMWAKKSVKSNNKTKQKKTSAPKENEDETSIPVSETVIPEEATPTPEQSPAPLQTEAQAIDRAEAEEIDRAQAAEFTVNPADDEPVVDTEMLVNEANTEPEKQTSYPTFGGRRARFEIKRTKDDRYVFNLYAANQVIVATSQIYSSAQSAINGIKSIIANAPKAPIEDQTLKVWEPLSFPKWEIYLDNAKQYRFRLNATNGNCVVHSQGYTTKASCKNGIESITKNAKDAVIEKAYLKRDEDK